MSLSDSVKHRSVAGGRGRKPGGITMHTMNQLLQERRLSVPMNAPPRVVEDIESYNAFLEMQSRMTGPASWYQKLA